MCAERRRIGILGGTFDPVHRGHLACAREVAEAFSLDTVLLVLAPRPPHKQGHDAVAPELRWRMLCLAVEEDAARHGAADPVTLQPCDVEFDREGPSWTIDTLRELARRHGDAQLFLILGIDAYEDIESWRCPGELLSLANLVVTTRPGRAFPQDALLPPVAARDDARYDSSIGAYVHTSGHFVIGHRIHGLEASATDIRRRARSGLPIADLTGDAVSRFIHHHGLYGVPAAGGQEG